MQRFSALLGWALLAALVGAIGLIPAAQAGAPSDAGLFTVRADDLPQEARATLALIRRGGPFPYPHKDGSIFGNFERRLPPQPRGYYREYTVPTPGRSDRGPRRIVAGEGRSADVATSGEYYYTSNHYRSFRRIVEP